MKTEELLNKYPKATTKLKEWWNKKIEQALSSENLSDEYKNAVTAMKIQDVQIIRTIDNNPHTLFEFFDENNIIIRIDATDDPVFFGAAFVGKTMYYKFKTRKQAERDILDDAFAMLEERL
ncbi:MAG: hypothetical protein H5T96_09560 [Tissierellales bacterium]|nr:hypothetical protein [Tissierellales bacterium]